MSLNFLGTRMDSQEAERLRFNINRTDLEPAMMGVEDQLKDGTVSAEGDVSILARLAATMVVFDQRLEIMPGTKDRSGTGGMASTGPYEAGTGSIVSR